ncbi:hypothetical protein HPHPH42_1651 [Helicobacter pylori Hp H-42]|uniref:Uncharacterized protein n=1 Tax=Helicobacter pylori Hp H-42 TaxID=992047 RepID=A0AB33XFA0_HELPX|nr:hypothetical protein HPHPH42_1651 [Helicobacter pylori Hp H-42]
MRLDRIWTELTKNLNNFLGYFTSLKLMLHGKFFNLAP